MNQPLENLDQLAKLQNKWNLKWGWIKNNNYKIRANYQLNYCWICELKLIGKNANHPDLCSTRDHVIPRSRGGKGPGNILQAHAWCNQKRDIFNVDEKMKIEFRLRMLKYFPELEDK